MSAFAIEGTDHHFIFKTDDLNLLNLSTQQTGLEYIGINVNGCVSVGSSNFSRVTLDFNTLLPIDSEKQVRFQAVEFLRAAANKIEGSDMISSSDFFGKNSQTVNTAIDLLTKALQLSRSLKLEGAHEHYWISSDIATGTVTVTFHNSEENKRIFDLVSLDEVNSRIKFSGWKAKRSDWKAGQRDNPFEFKIILEAL